MTAREWMRKDNNGVALFPEMLMYYVTGTDVNSISELCSQMEKRRYFTFWMTGTDTIDNLDKLFNQDPVLSRYVGYDECIIKKGEKSTIPLYDFNREINEHSDTRVKVYLLSQPARIEILSSDNHKDYTGSLFEDVASTYGR